MRHLTWAAMATTLLIFGCAAPPPPAPAPPPVPRPRPVARPAPPLDWFQQQVRAAQAARQSHLPKSDAGGARLAYDKVMRNACTRVALSGPDKYRARCESVLRLGPSEPDPFACDDSTTDPVALTACND